MLSPASLRVCCLAVMAPALTKADRRANCLPVVLSDPFCVSKTDASENRKDKINQIAKLPFKFVPLPNKRKPPHKIWVRTNGTDISTNKNIDIRADFVNAKLGLHVEPPKTKPCHGTSVRTMAAKVRLKYTMNKNNSSFKNMGLAKANTSLGLHSMKRMDRISQLSSNDNRNSSVSEKDLGGNSPDLADPTSSELETTFSIVRIVQPALEQSIEEVSSSSRNLIASSKHETFVSLSDSDALPVLSDPSTMGLISDNCSIPLSPDVNSSLSSRDSVLPISLPDSESPLAASKNESAALSAAHPQSPSCDVILTHKPELEIEVDDVTEKAQLLATNDASISDISPVECSTSHVNSPAVPHLPCTTEDDIHKPFDDDTHKPFNNDTHNPFDNDIHKPFDDDMSPLSPSCPSDIEPLSPCSTFSSSSTLSADESPLPSSVEDLGDSVFFNFPDLPQIRGTAVEVQAQGFTHTPCIPCKAWYDNPEGKVILNQLNNQNACLYPRTERCCSLQKQDRSSLIAMLVEQERVLNVALKESEVIFRNDKIRNIKDQLRTYVTHYQKKYDIPCQRQSRSARFMAPSEVPREAIDLKAEMLQNEDVASLSTAALVNLVRRLEPGVSSANLLQPGVPVNLLQPDILAEEFDSFIAEEDSEDVKDTGRPLIANLKSLLRCVDPDMTESSDEGCSDGEVEDALGDSIRRRALWNFLKKRAALASRSTWLIARIHELENQIGTVTGYLKKVSTSIGDVPFQDDAESSALSTAGSDGTSVPTTDKPKRPKGLGRPVNGYLDHGFSKTKSPSSEILKAKLSGSSASEPQCSRTRALNTSAFQKRKLLVTTGLHLTNPKMAKLSTVGCDCSCQDEAMPCVLCTGRYSCLQSVDPDSLPLLDRVSLLEPYFHPLLSFEKDVPLLVHYENTLKKNEAQYQTVRPPSPVLNSHSHRDRRMRFGTSSSHYGDARSRSRKINRYARTLLSAKYRNKKHFRKHKLVFGKWRKFQNKSTFHARDRIRRLSVASSASSHDSPVPSPGSAYDDGFGYDLKRRRDDNQFDIDDVIIPYSNKKSRLVKFEFKDIEIPSWRSKAFGNLQAIEIEEDTSDAAFTKRHEGYEIEERKIIRNGGGAKCFFNTWQKRSSRMHRADSSGANTPDPVLLYDQDIMFQDTSSQMISGFQVTSEPPSPMAQQASGDDSQPAVRIRQISEDSQSAMRPRQPSEDSQSARAERRMQQISGDDSQSATPRTRQMSEDSQSATTRTRQISEDSQSATRLRTKEVSGDDSQPALRAERRRSGGAKKPDENFVYDDEIAPYSPRVFPLPDDVVERMMADDDHAPYDTDVTASGASCPASPESTTSSASTDDDITDPEWRVVRKESGSEQALVLKFAKR